MLAVVVSRADVASEHIGEQLLELAEWNEHEDERRSDGEGGGMPCCGSDQRAVQSVCE